MEARTDLNCRLTGRDVAEGSGGTRQHPCCHERAVAEAPMHPFHGVAVRRSGVDPFDVNEVFKRTPYIADLKPAGRFVAKDLSEADNIPLVTKTLLENGFCTVSA